MTDDFIRFRYLSINFDPFILMMIVDLLTSVFFVLFYFHGHIKLIFARMLRRNSNIDCLEVGRYLR